MKKRKRFTLIIYVIIYLSIFCFSLIQNGNIVKAQLKSVNGYQDFSLIEDSPDIASYLVNQQNSIDLAFTDNEEITNSIENVESYRLELNEKYYFYKLFINATYNMLQPYNANLHITLESNYDHNGRFNEENYYPIGSMSIISSSNGLDLDYVITLYPSGLAERHVSDYFLQGGFSIFSFTKESVFSLFKISQLMTPGGISDIYQYNTEINRFRPISSIKIEVEFLSNGISSFSFYFSGLSGEFYNDDIYASGNQSFIVGTDSIFLVASILIICPIIMHKKSKN